MHPVTPSPLTHLTPSHAAGHTLPATLARDLDRFMTDLLSELRSIDHGSRPIRLRGASPNIQPMPPEAGLGAPADPTRDDRIVQWLVSGLSHIRVPVDTAQWPVISEGLHLLRQRVLDALVAGWTPPPGWDDKLDCLGQIQLHRTLLNPHLSSVDCLNELGRSEPAVVLLKRQLLAQAAPWSEAQCQLAWMLWPLAATHSGGHHVPQPSLNERIGDRLSLAAFTPVHSQDAMTLGARGLFELHPLTRQMHRDDGVAVVPPPSESGGT